MPFRAGTPDPRGVTAQSKPSVIAVNEPSTAHLRLRQPFAFGEFLANE